MPKKPHYLFAILNWGLGHASRCIPIIDLLLEKGYSVSIASDGRALHLLKGEYPELQFFELPSYNIKYSASGSSIKLLLQMFKLPALIRKENKALAEIIEKQDFDALISDNRFGCYSSKINSAFISHQLFIKAPFKFPFVERILASINKSYISKFDELWIPDVKGDPNLSGELSHKYPFSKIPKYFIGCLSRFKIQELPNEYDIAVVLSGPEPQRSILEKIILKQLHDTTLKVILVRGISEGSAEITKEGLVSKVDFLTTIKLNEIILGSKVIISRAGYTSIMDIVKLKKAAIFIPTPGQSEQIYLASYLQKQKLYYSCSQEKFRLEEALKKYSDYKNTIEINYGSTELESRLFSLSQPKNR